jgi:hypothetical protein
MAGVRVPCERMGIDERPQIDRPELAALEEVFSLLLDAGGQWRTGRAVLTSCLRLASEASCAAFGKLLGSAIDNPAPQSSTRRSACKAVNAISIPSSRLISSKSHLEREWPLWGIICRCCQPNGMAGMVKGFGCP